jgi:hypothetical protein
VGTLKDGVYVRKLAFTAILSIEQLKKTCQYFKKRALSYIGYTVRKSGPSSTIAAVLGAKTNKTGNAHIT